MEEHDPTDADLVSDTLQGDREAFGCLFDRYARMVRAVAGGVSLDWTAVEDMTQESFLRAYRNLSQLRDHHRFGAWIVGIARQVARERRRSLARDRHEFIAAPPETVPSLADINPTEETEQADLLMRTIATLPERERLAIHAFFLQDRNAQQAADLLQLSRSGLYAALKKGLDRLRSTLQTQDWKEKSGI